MDKSSYRKFYADMGWRLKQLRQRHMSQKRLGEQIGRDYTTIQKYEDGTVRIPGFHLHRFCEIFGVPAGYFFGEHEDGRVDTDALAIAGAITKLPSRQVQQDIHALVVHLNEAWPSEDESEAA